MVKLKKIDEENYRECINLKVEESQQKFVSANVLSLAKSYVYYDKVTPFAIYNDDIMVGFILLRFNEEYSNYFIWQLMIDGKYQSKGYGRQALEQAIKWMKNDSRCKEIVTTYIEGNDVARELYYSLGFKQLGELIDGEVDMILKLT